MTRVAVSRKVLRWAMERSRLSADDVQDKFPRIQEWLRGHRQPTLRQLESLARTTHTPLGFFFLKEPPEDRMPVPYLRTSGSGGHRTPSPDLLETIHVMQQRQTWMSEFLVEQGQEALPIVKSAQRGERPEAISRRIGDQLGLESRWATKHATWEAALRFLRDRMEDAGILVVVNSIVGNDTHRKLDPGEFRGFVLVDAYAPLVFVNGADGKAAQMFTLAHELAHVVFGSSAAFDLRRMLPADDPMEEACNRLAAEFLVSGSELREIWPSVKDVSEPFQSVARRFKVSRIVAARRALDLALITKSEFFRFYTEYQRDERRRARRKPEGGDFYATQNLRVGRRFASAVARATSEGKLLFSEAYKLTGMYGRTFERYVSSLRMEGGRGE